MRNTKTSLIGLLLSVSALAFAAKPASVSDSDNNGAQLAKYLDVYNSIFKQLSLYYVDTINAKKIISSSIDEALSSLDPYTSYIPDEESSDFKFMTTGQYGGIGAVISQHPRSYSIDSTKSEAFDVLISEPYEGLPADKAGLRAGDVIVQIDKTKIKGQTLSEVSAMLRGIPGTELEVIVNRGSDKKVIKKRLVREKITIPAVTYYGVVGDSTAYILLDQFTEKSAEGVRTAINDLKSKHKITSIVLDLRNNPGGLLDQAVERQGETARPGVQDIFGGFVARHTFGSVGELIVGFGVGDCFGRVAGPRQSGYHRHTLVRQGPCAIDSRVAIQRPSETDHSEILHTFRTLHPGDRLR